jgi:crotonobetainyl-CoA:carnitine CoA-transferase CaiB-like acyl-CoA transferase
VTADAASPLVGHRVLSLAEQYPGPYATLLLGDLGAEVVQVERPAGGDPARMFPGVHEALNRGKRSVALDLKHSGARAACRRLVERADVLLDGYRPGVLDRLGLGADVVTAANPGLVYVSITGFGQDGPYRDWPAHDLSFQALTGLLDPDEPAMPELSLADLCSGVFAALAAVTGLAARTRTGRGGRYDVSMFDTLLSFATTRLVPRANGVGPDALGLDPGYGLYRTADGRWLSLSIAFEDHFWRALCGALGLDGLADVPGVERIERRAELQRAIADVLLGRTLAHWERVLEGAAVPHGAVRGPGELLRDPQVVARRMLQEVGGRTYVRQPITVDGTAPGPQSTVPRLGQHTVEVLREAGIARTDIEALLDAGAALDATAAAEQN